MIQKLNVNERYNKGQHPMVTTGLVAPRIFESGTDHDTTADLHNNWVQLVNPTPLENVQDIEGTLITHPEMAIDDTLQLEEDHVVGVDTHNFPTTDTAVEAVQVRHAAYGESNYQVPCHIVLNQCGTLLVRDRHELRGGKKEQFFLQKLVSSSTTTIPLLYPEGMLFPSIFYSAAKDGYSIVGAMPSAILGQQGNISANGFANLREHSRTRYTMYSSLAGVDFRYKAFLFDALANATLNNKDSRIVMHRGYEQSSHATGMAVRDTKDVFLSDMIDSRTVIQELSAAEKVDSFTLFFH